MNLQRTVDIIFRVHGRKGESKLHALWIILLQYSASKAILRSIPLRNVQGHGPLQIAWPR